MIVKSVSSTQDFQFISGSLALDFVNTVGNRLGESRDYFSNSSDIARWIELSNCLPQIGRTRVNGADLTEIRFRREYLYTLFLPFARGAGQTSARALSALNRDILRLSQGRNMGYKNGQFQWTFAGRMPEKLAHVIVSDAADLLASGRWKSIRQCQDSSCGWLFLDRSPKKMRRWCSMRDCGNRAKARRFYAQHRGEDAA